jgi:hypothetical protein
MPITMAVGRETLQTPQPTSDHPIGVNYSPYESINDSAFVRRDRLIPPFAKSRRKKTPVNEANCAFRGLLRHRRFQ